MKDILGTVPKKNAYSAAACASRTAVAKRSTAALTARQADRSLAETRSTRRRRARAYCTEVLRVKYDRRTVEHSSMPKTREEADQGESLGKKR